MEYTPLERLQIECGWLKWHADNIRSVNSLASAQAQLAQVQRAWDDLVQHESLRREREESMGGGRHE